MSEIILHHYPDSPFSEKIRLLLGYKNLAYNAVTIPVIMPKPDLTELTGGYRKTPVMQIGADIYCDSAIICKVIDRINPDKPIYPAQSLAASAATAQWTDTFFFKVAVSMAFQPQALATNPRFQDPDIAAAFMADRAKLTEGSSSLRLDFKAAEPYFLGHLSDLDTQLACTSFLYGDAPTIADFSTYHCLWFVYRIEVLRDTFAPFEHVLAWLERMGSFGQGALTEIDGATALDIAKNATPASIDNAGSDSAKLGSTVEVTPIDYGFQPVKGQLVLASNHEIVLTRSTDRVGEVAVHFPRVGFQIEQIG